MVDVDIYVFTVFCRFWLSKISWCWATCDRYVCYNI